jgi:hypothetical protein
MKRLLTIFICASLSAFILAQEQQKPQAQQQPPAARKIPGITDVDAHPNACVDCHVNRPDMNFDGRLSTVMTGWYKKTDPDIMKKVQGAAPSGITLSGVHPDATPAFKSIPGACIKCHRSKSNAPSFDGVIHIIHLTGGDNNHYLTFYQGECTNCHKLDQTTGSWNIPSNPEK